MADIKKEFGVVGLGKMGGNLAMQALQKRMRVVGYTRSHASQNLLDAGLVEIDSPARFKDQFESPRAVFMYVPAGPIVNSVIDQLASHLEDGDIIVDGGNSYWGDSIRRHNKLRLEKGIHYVDLGTSGGIEGARHGACFMAGGEPEAIARIEPILNDLSVEGGYVHAGATGAGHFVKLVHNGIEFGMLQAIAEGMALLEHYHQNRSSIDIANTLNCWCHGSVIRSWLVELMHKAYSNQGGLASIPPYVEDTGEVNWLVNDALQMEVPTPVINQSVVQLFTSRDDQQNWARAIAMMRHGFGGHPYGHSEKIVKERHEGRVGSFLSSENP
ncbi:phosphogluconate dehydrogenase (NAD(+)-dependent, decarboxylating) [Coleofasciculus chthonoplastes]|uniref:phosphogluconate dehydrogenase (NAD(+)-dependent, decarboxylating) n=1 Tax=Coleofasciculus chthonoplastes TaxID=64178 RepID=UPI0032F639BA